ncbi:MAG: hydroxyphenylacetyl-CoA thioesterase PaaI [Alphaproteobacteria bacterium]|nr:hydroxyphenylacetyl-CoA thioesterase PaaI [Alphaproteobacteria bacterium]MCB9928584.1 hydroxyphenylacetyl-CoA thioesterase PaaI [Alphaproteobacteria bacterium]
MSGRSPQELAEAVAARLRDRDPASGHIGLALVSVGPGTATIAMTVEPHLANGLNVCHGGYIFTLADTAMAYASNASNRPALAQAAHVTFLAPGLVGDRLTAVATETAQAGRNGVYDVEVRNQDGKQIAVFRGQTRTVQGEILTE